MLYVASLTAFNMSIHPLLSRIRITTVFIGIAENLLLCTSLLFLLAVSAPLANLFPTQVLTTATHIVQKKIKEPRQSASQPPDD